MLGVCTPCIDNCIDCSDDASCTTCDDGYWHDSDVNECKVILVDCDVGSYRDD
jgi:hypothetical protein